MEHVTELNHSYESMYKWLKPNGFMSHTIDFKSHGTSGRWNGHWTYSDFEWKFITGRKKFLINRAPHSTHMHLLNKNGFKIIRDIKTTLNSGIQRKKLTVKFKDISNGDLSTSVCFIQAVKRSPMN